MLQGKEGALTSFVIQTHCMKEGSTVKYAYFTRTKLNEYIMGI